jgi:hypothetical protein
MAEIKFYGNILADDASKLIAHGAGSGLGFFGSTFGISVPVGSQQSTTWVTNANGTASGIQLPNTSMYESGTFTSIGKVKVNNNDAIFLNNLPNYLCPLNVRFTHDTPVRVQNCKLRIFDRNNINNPASGVTTWVYEARHPSENQSKTSLSFRGNKDQTSSEGYRWTEFDPTEISPGANIDMNFTSSPGVSGTNTDTTDTDTTLGFRSQSGISLKSARHDWYVALSSQPDGIGSKTNYGLYFTLEYLS